MTVRMRLLPLIGAALIGAAAAQQKPDENSDLELIPKAAQAPAPASNAEGSAPTAAPGKIYLENAFTQSWQQSGLVPIPPPQPPDWQERLLLDVRKDWRLASTVTLAYSGRVNLRAGQDLSFPSHENATNDLREAYASWEPLERTYVDAGRINLKSGVALGFNPTDFFRTRAVVEPLSVDPVVLREDRLGTLMVRTQRIWAGASLTAAFAPAAASRSPIYRNDNLPSLNPMFDRTNALDRFVLKGNADIGGGFSPELLFYRDTEQTRWGMNVAQSAGQSVVAYAEWSGGRSASLIDDALRFGRETGTLPPAAPSALPENALQGFQSQLALGASYATQTRITFNLEYHFYQAGFSRTDWNNWFRAGQGQPNTSPIAGELWYIRAYAVDQQVPVSRHSIFLRADWVDAFIPKLELSGFADVDAQDGSRQVQLTADYVLSDAWTVGALALVNSGGQRSDFGSLPQGVSVLLKVARYF